MKLWKRIISSPWTAAVVIVAAVFGPILSLRVAGGLELLELYAYDLFLRLEPGAVEPPPVTAVLIDENDLRQYGWPVTDAMLTRAFKLVLEESPRAVGLDIYRDMPVPPGHGELTELFRESTGIIATMKFGQSAADKVMPPEVLAGTDRAAFNDVLVDPGGIVRRGLLFLDDGVNYYTSFALRLAIEYLAAEGIYPQPDPENPNYIRIGKATIRPLEPDDGAYVGGDMRGYQFLLDYAYRPASVTRISLDDLFSRRVDPSVIRDRIVLIGFSAESVQDFFYTPMSRTFLTHQQTTGVVLHGIIAGQIIRAARKGAVPKSFWADHWENLWILLWTVLGVAVGLRFRSPWTFLAFVAGGLAGIGLSGYGLFSRGWWVPVVPPALAWAGAAGLSAAYTAYLEHRQRALLMTLFSRSVSPEVAEAIWQQREEVLESGRLRSRKLVATMMFVDLKGYTAVSEKLDPQELIEWLNSYLEFMTDAVIDHGGIVNTYLGDGFMAGFGIPLPRSMEEERKLDASRAVRCALALGEGTEKLNGQWEDKGMPEVQVRVGIHTGPLVAGSLGSSERMMYTTIGDTVNVASRLESVPLEEVGFTPGTSCRVLVSDTTRGYLEDEFDLQSVGELALKGKEKALSVYRVLGPGPQKTLKEPV